MGSLPRHGRLLPLTMTVIALLFTEKAVVLARDVRPKDPTTVTQPASAPARGSVAATDHPAAAGDQAPASDARPSAAELGILQDLRKRRQTLDERERRLDQRDELLQAAESKLQVKLDELTTLQQQLAQGEDARRKHDAANWSGLVKTYEDMKPRDAAAIFDVLDMSVLLEVLDRMDERKAAAVLAAMLPERARLATQMLAQKRTRREGVPSATAATPIASDQHS